MTEFQNRRQHWIFPFFVGVTNVQHVASLSLRFIMKKLMNSALRLNVAPVATKHSIPTLQNRKLNPALLPAPLYKKDWRNNLMKKEPKTEIISTRVTPEQREIIEEKAYSSYRTPSMYLRDCALDKKIIVVKGVDDVANELRKIGNNLNQIAREVNSGYLYEVNLTETKKELKRIWQSLNSLTQEVR